MEREYYFDEGLGQSLQEHVNELKKNFPDIKLQTRRDRDGFAIVKMTQKPKYKYNLNDIEDIINMEPAEIKKKEMETQEAILSVFMPNEPRDFFQKTSAVRAGNSESTHDL